MVAPLVMTNFGVRAERSAFFLMLNVISELVYKTLTIVSLTLKNISSGSSIVMYACVMSHSAISGSSLKQEENNVAHIVMSRINLQNFIILNRNGMNSVQR